MRHRNLLPIALFVGLALSSPTWAVTIQEVVDGISQTRYAAFHADSLYTHSGQNRGLGGAEHDPARTNIYNAFADLGLAPALDPFTYSGSTYYNVVATLPGTLHPEQVYIVGAHYDSVNNPGADDNASGVAGIVEAARVLSQYDFQCTLRFIAFDREEQGLYGSAAYACSHGGDQIRGMISMDMIAYNPAATANQARIYYAADNSPLTQDLADNLLTYGGITAAIGQMGYSDHKPFDDCGFNAALLIEYAWASNSHYHKATDAVETPNYIDYAYAANMTRGVVGYLAGEAVLVPEPGTLALLLAGMAGCWFARRSRRAL